MRRLGDSGKTAGDQVDEAFRTLGVRSISAVKDEIAKTAAAYDALARSGKVSGEELGRAFQLSAQRIAALKAEIATGGPDIARPVRDLQAASASAAPAVSQLESTTGGLLRTLAGFAAAAIGVNSVVDALRTASQAAQSVDRISNGLLALTGSSQAAGAAFAFIRSESSRLGLDLQSVSTEFVKLTASTQGTRLEGEETRKLFSAIAQAGTVLGLSGAEVSRAFQAISQTAGKGTVSLEEIRGQLGDAIPGAVQIAARALGVTTAEFERLVENGLDATAFLPKFRAELERTFGGGVAGAAQSTTAEFNRLRNAIFELAAEVGRGGLNEGLAEAARILREQLANPATVETLRKIGAAIGELAVFVANNVDQFAKLAAIIAGGAFLNGALRAFQAAGAAVAGFRAALAGVPAAAALAGASATAAGAEAATASGRFSALGAVLTGLSRAIIPITVAIVGYETLKLAADGLTEYALARRKLSDAERGRVDQLKTEIAAREQQAEQLQRFASVEIKTEAQVAQLSEEKLARYREELQGRKDLAAAELGAANRKKELLELEEQEIRSTTNNRAALALNAAAQREASAAIAAASARVSESRNAIEALTNAQNFAAQAAENRLTPAAQRLIDKFEGLRSKGGEVRESVSKIFDGFNPASLSQTEAIVLALNKIGASGLEAGRAVREELFEQLRKAPLAELQAFQITATAAFGGSKGQVDELNLALDASLRAALARVNVDAEQVATGLSKSFRETAGALDLVASNARATGAQILAAFEASVGAARTKAEVDSLTASIEQFGRSGKLSTDQVAIAQDALRDRINQVRQSALDAARAQVEVVTAIASAQVANANAQAARNSVQVETNRLTQLEAQYRQQGGEALRQQVEAQRLAVQAAVEAARAAELEARFQQLSAQATREKAEAARLAREAEFQGTEQAKLAAAAAQDKAEKTLLAAEAARAEAIASRGTAEASRTAAQSAASLASSLGSASSVAGGVANALGQAANNASRTADELRRAAREAADLERVRRLGANVDSSGFSTGSDGNRIAAVGRSELEAAATIKRIIQEAFGTEGFNSQAAQEYARFQLQLEDYRRQIADNFAAGGRGPDAALQAIIANLERGAEVSRAQVQAELERNNRDRIATAASQNPAPSVIQPTPQGPTAAEPSRTVRVQFLNPSGGAAGSGDFDDASLSQLLDGLRQAGARVSSS